MIIGRNWVIQWLKHRPLIQVHSLSTQQIIYYSHHDEKLPSTQDNIERQSEEPFWGSALLRKSTFLKFFKRTLIRWPRFLQMPNTGPDKEMKQL